MTKVYKDEELNIFGSITEFESINVDFLQEEFGYDSFNKREKLVTPLRNFYSRFPLTQTIDGEGNEVGFKIFSAEEVDSNFYNLFFQMLNDISDKNYSYVLNSGIFLVYLDEKLIHIESVGEFDEEIFSDMSKLKAQQDKENGKKEILIATRNEGKTKEFKEMFGKLGYKVKNLNDYPDLPDVAETGMTFEENARLKAETISELTGQMVLADDSGLMVDVLGGLPGVWSARFAGENATDAANNAKLLHELASTSLTPERRTARFHTTLVVAAPDKESLVVEADWDGAIATIPKGDNGFGYDPLFEVGETGKTAAQMSMEEKNKVSHRAKALEKLMKVWGDWAK